MQLRPYQNSAKNNVLCSAIGQVISPTGTGKSVIQGSILESKIKIADGFGIFVILTPRILLTNQLMKDVGTQLMRSKINLRALTIHSGQGATFVDEDSEDIVRYIAANIGMKRTTNYQDAIVAFKDAQALSQPILVCCTYDSVPTLTAALKHGGDRADQALCDEAHYIVEKQFHQNITGLKEYSDNTHFFTATQKVTVGEYGNGMNNTEFYGQVVFRATPREMIDQGYMIRPRIHYEKAESKAPWSEIVKDAFEVHQEQVSYNAKMLVCCNGTKTLREIGSSPKFQAWAKENKVTIFAISSADGPSVNGVSKDRDEFLKLLRSHTGRAVILHIAILTEGIDVPDITGVMYIRNMGTTRFLQSLGRATRVHKDDFGKPTNDFEVNSAQWVKPYAWAIIAERDGDNEGKTADLETIIKQMRQAGFEPTEEVVIAFDRGTGGSAKFRPCNPPPVNLLTTFGKFFDLHHEIECEKLAAMSDEDALNAVPI